MKRIQTIQILLAILPGVNAQSVMARMPDPQKVVVEAADVSSMAFDGNGVQLQSAFREIIERPGTRWMRLRIGEHDLGRASYITIMSLKDGQIQHHTAATLEEWSNWSAIFGGDAVEVELHVAPDDVGVFVDVDAVAFAEIDETVYVPEPMDGVASICGDVDNRAASNDSRVARLFFGGCTAWLISNGGVLTAGHCTNDNTGDIPGVIEFNVPLSTANGNSNPAATVDQYPVLSNTIAFQDNGVGNDWARFRVGANTETGLSAHVAQGFFRLTDSSPAVDTTLRVTGYGLDNRPAGPGGSGAQCCDANNDDRCEYNCNTSSLTQQTHTGRLDDIEGYDIEHEVDTMPANSGSPIIWETNGLAIGIHTAGGCDDFWSGNNNFGTHFLHPTLATWINNIRGDNARYVDSARNLLIPLGTVFRPYNSVAMGVSAVPNGGVVSIVAGSYPASAGNTFTAGSDNKAMTLEAPVGIVTIGN